MNPIEHVWDFIGRKINQRNPKCQNIDELRTAILSYKSGNSSPKNGLGVLCEAWRGVLQNFTINAVDILVIDLYALHIRTIDEFKSH